MSGAENVLEYEILMGGAGDREESARRILSEGEDTEDACFGILAALISIAETLRARELREGAAFKGADA